MLYIGDTVEQLHPDVTLQWRFGQRIAHFEIRSDHRAAIDAWAERVMDITFHWTSSQPYLVIHDVTHSTLTPYARQRALEVTSMHSNLPAGRYAVVVAPNLLGKAIALFVNRDISRQAGKLEGHCFTHIDEALGWLEKSL